MVRPQQSAEALAVCPAEIAAREKYNKMLVKRSALVIWKVAHKTARKTPDGKRSFFPSLLHFFDSNQSTDVLLWALDTLPEEQRREVLERADCGKFGDAHASLIEEWRLGATSAVAISNNSSLPPPPKKQKRSALAARINSVR